MGQQPRDVDDANSSAATSARNERPTNGIGGDAPSWAMKNASVQGHRTENPLGGDTMTLIHNANESAFDNDNERQLYDVGLQ